MTALPSNLALVGEDLARATLRDARRSRARRRLATYAVAFALLALTATAAVASGWLFGDEQPVVRVAPVARRGGRFRPPPIRRKRHQQGMTSPNPRAAIVLSSPRRMAPPRSATPSAPRERCSPASGRRSAPDLRADDDRRRLPRAHRDTARNAFRPSAQAITSIGSSQPKPGEPTVVWGLVSDDVARRRRRLHRRHATKAALGNGGFYAELTEGSPDQLILHLADGSSEAVEALPCPLTTPDCTP